MKQKKIKLKLKHLEEEYSEGLISEKKYIKKKRRLEETEPVSGTKFWKGFFDFLDPVQWLKDIVSIFNVRKLIIYAIVIVSVFSWAYVKGAGNEPVQWDFDYEKPFVIKVPDSEIWLKKPKNSNELVWIDKNGNVIDKVRTEDLPQIRKKLSPLGVQLEPIGVVGAGFGARGTEIEAGAGVSWFRAWRARIDAFLTNKGIYPVGVSYKMEGLFDNSSVGMAIGKGWSGDNRVMTYFSFEF